MASAVLVGLGGGPAFAQQRAPAVRDPAPAGTNAPASLLGIDGDDAARASELTGALQAELDRRGLGGGRGATTAEIRIALECETLDDVCLGRAARLLGARRVVFGSLHGDEQVLELHLFVADTRRVEKSVSVPVSAEDLASAGVSDTAARALEVLFPEDRPAADELPPAGPTSPPVAESAPEPAASSDGRRGEWQWGAYSPRPKWKWAAFGTSTALFGVGLVATLVTAIPVARSNRGKGFLHERLRDEASASLEDDDPINDVDPDAVLDICSDAPGSFGALEILDAGVAMPGVRNATVGRECKRAAKWARAATGAMITTAVLAVPTVVFTVLLFVHREPASSRLSFGVAPDLAGGGAHVTGHLRF